MSNELLEDALEAIADGRPVDWSALESSDRVSTGELRSMRAIAAVRWKAPPPFPPAAEGLGEARAPDDLPAALRERLEITGRLGSGAFGQVFLARDRVLDREVALKVFRQEVTSSPEARERFLDEARTLAGLKHPNILQIHWIEEVEDRVYLILELIRGKNLAEILDAEGALAPEEAARIAADVCRALAELHGKGLVHMDIKPANIAREEGGRIVLLDFGFARASDPGGEGGGRLGGTPLFMAPEILEGREHVPPTADIYSVGILLYHAVSGHYPFDSQELMELRERVLAGRGRPLLDVCPGVPPEYAALVDRATAREEAHRFASVGELEQALRRFLASTAGTGEEAPARSRPGPAVPLLLGLAAALLVVVVWILGSRGGGAAAPTLEFACELYAQRAGAEVPLGADATVSVGDNLFLRAEADRAFHLYVFNEDQTGKSYTLYPVPDLGMVNPVAAGVVDLPGGEGDERTYWVVDSAGGGAEHLYVVASLTPVPALESLRRFVPDVSAGLDGVAFADLSGSQRGEVLRGVGQVSPNAKRVSEGTDQRLGEVFASLRAQLEGDGGTVVHVLRLAH